MRCGVSPGLSACFCATASSKGLIVDIWYWECPLLTGWALTQAEFETVVLKQEFCLLLPRAGTAQQAESRVDGGALCAAQWVKCRGRSVVGGVCVYVCWNSTLWRKYHNFHHSIWSSYTHVLYYLPSRKHPPTRKSSLCARFCTFTQTPTQHDEMLCRAGRHNLRSACICSDAPCSIWFILPLDGLDCGMLCTCTQRYMLKPGFCKGFKKKKKSPTSHML